MERWLRWSRVKGWERGGRERSELRRLLGWVSLCFKDWIWGTLLLPTTELNAAIFARLRNYREREREITWYFCLRVGLGSRGEQVCLTNGSFRLIFFFSFKRVGFPYTANAACGNEHVRCSDWLRWSLGPSKIFFFFSLITLKAKLIF